MKYVTIKSIPDYDSSPLQEWLDKISKMKKDNEKANSSIVNIEKLIKSYNPKSGHKLKILQEHVQKYLKVLNLSIDEIRDLMDDLKDRMSVSYYWEPGPVKILKTIGK